MIFREWLIGQMKSNLILVGKKANDWHYCTIPDSEKYEFQEKNGKAVEKVNEFINLLKNKKTGICYGPTSVPGAYRRPKARTC